MAIHISQEAIPPKLLQVRKPPESLVYQGRGVSGADISHHKVKSSGVQLVEDRKAVVPTRRRHATLDEIERRGDIPEIPW